MTAPALHAGSPKSVADHTLARLLGQLRAAAEDTTLNVREAHNHYTIYVLVVLFLATGLRPVRDPVESIDLVDDARGLAVGCDKVIRHPLESRLLALGDKCVALLRRYLDHLLRLADALQEEDDDLAEAIPAVTTRGLRKPLPLFFTFAEHCRVELITPSVLIKRVPLLAQLEANIGRCWIASLGCAQDVDADLIRAALGHHEMGLAVFGPNSPRCPSELRSLAQCIDQRLAAMGVQVIGSPLPPMRSPSPGVVIGQRHAALGIANRAQAQRLQAAAAKALHRRALAQCVAQSRRNRLVQADIDAVFRSICGAAGHPQTRVQVEAYSRTYDVLSWLLARQELPLTLPPRYRPLTVGLLSTHRAAFFEPATLALARECDDLARALDRWLVVRAAAANVDRGNIDAKTAKKGVVGFCIRVAEATASLAVHSRVADPQLLDCIAMRAYELLAVRGAGAFGVFDVAGTGPDVPMLRRVVLHPATLALLHSLKAMQGDAPPHRVKEQVLRLVNHLHQSTARSQVASYLSELTEAGAGSPSSAATALQWLCRRVGALNAVTLPGVVVSHLDGTARAVGLRAGPFARVLTGLPLADAAPVDRRDVDSAARKAVTDKSRPFMVDRAVEPDKRKSQGDELARFYALTRAVNRVLRGYSRLGSRRARSGPREKDRLIAKLEAVCQQHSSAPPEAHMGVQFLIWMLTYFRGGDAPQHHISTSLRYYYAVMPRVPLAMLEARCHGQGADVLADVYGAALDAVAPRGQAYVFNRLQLFHAAMQVDYGLPDVDWADVAPIALVGTCAVDAGIVNYDEYHTALELLVADPGSDKRMRNLQAWVLVVTYRFGLRISETLGLRRKDIWRDDKLPVLLIRPNAYRELKSDAGQRVVPLIGSLSKLERKVFNNWIAHVDENFGDDEEATMAATRDVARLMVQTDALRSRIRQALQVATGDESVRLHHLRHAFAMRLQIIMSVEALPTNAPLAQALARVLGPTDLLATRQLLLDTSKLSHRGLTAARVIVGHASVEVFRRSYAHLDDLISAAYLMPIFEGCALQVDNKILSYMVGARIARPIKADSPSTLTQDMVDDILFERLAGVEPLLARRSEPLALPIIEAPPPANLRLVDIDRVLDIVHRRRGVDGLTSLTMWPAEALGELLDAEHRVREMSRYDISDSGWPPTSATASVSHIRAGRRMLHETRRVTVLLQGMQKLLESTEFLAASRRVCEIWSRCYRPDTTPWVLPNVDDLHYVVRWCLAMGVKTEQLLVRAPSAAAASTEENPWTKEPFAALAQEVCGDKTLPAARRSATAAAEHSRQRFGLLVVENDVGPLMRMTHLNRVMHVLSTWLSLGVPNIKPRQ